MDNARSPPTYLYKYRSLACMKWIEEIVKDATVYFPNPLQINDPFDCRIPPLGAFDKEFFNNLLNAKATTGVAPTNAEKKAAESGDFSEAYQEIQKRVYQIGVFSLCEDPQNLLMWSHYADGHKGICLRFNTTKWGLLRYALPIRYQSFRRPLNFDRVTWNKGEIAKAIALTKYGGWKYEKEWRLVDERRHCHVEFPPESLDGLIFGCEISEADRAKVKQFLAASRVKPELFQAKREDKAFSLTIEPLGGS